MTAPNTPAPSGAPQITILPSGNEQGAPRESAVEKATREAHDRLNTSGSAALPTPAAPAAPAAARHPGTGQFVEKGRTDVAREVGSTRTPAPAAPAAAPAPTDAAPAAGQGAPGASEEPPREGEAPAAPEPAAGQPAAEPAPGTEAAPSDAEGVEGDVLSVVLPGRHEGEEFEVIVDTPEAADRLRQLRNSAMRAEEVRIASEDIMRRENGLAEREQVIDLDPIGHIIERFGDMPEAVDHMVLYLATQPEVYERLRERLESLSDEGSRRLISAEERARRSDVRDQLREETETRAAVGRNLRDVQATVGSLLPPEMAEAQQRILYHDCLRDLKEHADRLGILTIPIKDVPVILAQRLVAYGINPTEAATRAAESAARRGAAVARRPGPVAAGTRGQPAAPRASTPQPGKKFVANARAKGDAARIPSAGAGSPAGSGPITPPRNADGSKMTIEQTVTWHRSQIAKRKVGT